eukprot:SAG22_NODE_889_length_6648_cov_6.695984_4_plen_313_part_00
MAARGAERSESPAARPAKKTPCSRKLLNFAVFAALLSMVAGPLGLTTKMAEVATPMALSLMEQGLMPDVFTRVGIRLLLQTRLDEENMGDMTKQQERKQGFVDELKSLGIAQNTSEANDQHYEVSAELYDLMLGKHRKYSGALYPEDGLSRSTAGDLLDEAEVKMLRVYAERAGITADSAMRVLDMGCGWGSVSLWFAKNYPKSEFRGISNSNSQREWIMARAKEQGLTNLRIYTGNIVEWDAKNEDDYKPFDRVISIEMLEHMKNYEMLFGKVATWLKDDGKMFVHIFTHKTYAYREFWRGGSPACCLLPR